MLTSDTRKDLVAKALRIDTYSVDRIFLCHCKLLRRYSVGSSRFKCKFLKERHIGALADSRKQPSYLIRVEDGRRPPAYVDRFQVQSKLVYSLKRLLYVGADSLYIFGDERKKPLRGVGNE